MTNPSKKPISADDILDKILIVDDNPTNIQILYESLSNKGFKLLIAKNGKDAIEIAKKMKPALVLLDIMMPDMDGYETCRRLKSDPNTKDSTVIFLSALSETTDKIEGFSVGAVDYITKPFQGEEVFARVTTHLTVHRLKNELELKNRKLERDLLVAQEILKDAYERLDGPLLGESGAVKKLREDIKSHLATDETVLLVGAPGAGEEAVARFIHHQSKRREGPFIRFNCLTEKLNQQASKFELADGGTFYFDEISGLAPELQKRLADFLKSPADARRDTQGNPLDVRLIAFTSSDLAENVRKGNFNEDLFHILNKRRLTIPELMERQDDIPVLAEHFVQKIAKRFSKVVKGISEESMQLLKKYRWPGNIQELESLLERVTVNAQEDMINIDPGLLDTSRFDLVDIKIDKSKIQKEVDELLKDFDAKV